MTTDHLDFRPATPEDADYSYDLYKRSMQNIISTQIGGWPEEQMRGFFLSKFINPDSKIILRNGKRVGCFQISESETYVWLGRTYLETDCRNNGLGSRLVQQALDLAHSKKKPLIAEVAKNNTSGLSYFQRKGFLVYDENEWEFLIKHKDTMKYCSSAPREHNLDR